MCASHARDGDERGRRVLRFVRAHAMHGRSRDMFHAFFFQARVSVTKQALKLRNAGRLEVPDATRIS